MRASCVGLKMVWALCVLAGFGALGGCSSGERVAPSHEETFRAAMAAIEAGKDEEGMTLLNEAIAAKPEFYALYERARLREKKGDDAGATADVDLALQQDPDGRDLKWLKGELGKPKAQRFKGANAEPPSASK
jgi:hypothetical protein